MYVAMGVGYTEDGKKKLVLYRRSEYVYGQKLSGETDLLSLRQFNQPQIGGLVQNPSDLKPFTAPVAQSTTPQIPASQNQSFWTRIWNFIVKLFRW